MSLGTDLFGLIAGALGLLALFHSVVVSQLPKNKIKELDTILRETENQFYEDMAYGFLSNKTFIAQVKEQLIAYHLEYDKVRSRALGAKSFSAGFVELLKGLSITISALSRQITYLQADIITTSQEARMEMARTGRLQNQYARRAALICPDIVDEPIPASQADSEARPSLRTPPLSKVSEPGQEGRPPCAPKRSRSCPPGASGDDVVVDPWILLARDSNRHIPVAEASQLDIVLPVFRPAPPSRYKAPKFGRPVFYGPPSRPESMSSCCSFADIDALEKGEMH